MISFIKTLSKIILKIYRCTILKFILDLLWQNKNETLSIVLAYWEK